MTPLAIREARLATLRTFLRCAAAILTAYAIWWLAQAAPVGAYAVLSRGQMAREGVLWLAVAAVLAAVTIGRRAA